MQGPGRVSSGRVYSRVEASMIFPPGEQHHHWSGISTNPTAILCSKLLFLSRQSNSYNNNYCLITEQPHEAILLCRYNPEWSLIGNFLLQLHRVAVTNLQRECWQKCGAFVCRQKSGGDNLRHFCTRMAKAHLTRLAGIWKSKMECYDLREGLKKGPFL